jgi:uncharacterized C2H2 Zn-finger protein
MSTPNLENFIVQRAGKPARSRKRSRSGAHEKCPDCGKLLRGTKGMKAHRDQMHGGK